MKKNIDIDLRLDAKVLYINGKRVDLERRLFQRARLSHMRDDPRETILSLEYLKQPVDFIYSPTYRDGDEIARLINQGQRGIRKVQITSNFKPHYKEGFKIPVLTLIGPLKVTIYT